MSNNILFVFEGTRTEPKVFDRVKDLYFKDDNPVIFYSFFDAELFQLCQKIKEDEYIDLIELLKDRHKDNHEIDDIEFSEIYLFFDHDAHSHPELTQKEYYDELKSLFDIFDNETEQGKIYISYPMIEAFKDCKTLEEDDLECSCFQSISDNVNYKELAAERSDFNIRDKDQWDKLIGISYLRALKLVDAVFDSSEFNLIPQGSIYEHQYVKHVSKLNEIMILSAIPLFLLDYYGQSLYREFNISELNIYCKYFCV